MVSKSNRVYDEEGFLKRAACVCVRDSDPNQVLLVSSTKEPTNWIIPGGGLERNEQCENAAKREAHEEAGVLGQLGQCLGEFENIERKHRTMVFVLHVTHELPESPESDSGLEKPTEVIAWEGRRRQWFSVDDALVLLKMHKPMQSRYLLRFQELQTETTPS